MIYIIGDTDLTLTMPDGSTRGFTLQAPTGGQAPWWFAVKEEAPSGQRLYKDPLRRRQKAWSYYYPEFHFSYGHHRMFTSALLAARNIALQAGFYKWPVDVLLANPEAVKNYLEGMAVAGPASDPVPSGELELVLVGRARESWQQATRYYFYWVPGLVFITADSTRYTVDSTQVRIY